MRNESRDEEMQTSDAVCNAGGSLHRRMRADRPHYENDAVCGGNSYLLFSFKS